MLSIPFSAIGQLIYLASMLAGFVAATWVAFRRHRYCRIVLGYGILWASPILLAEALFLAFCWMAWESDTAFDLQTTIERDNLLVEMIVSVPGKFVGSVLFLVAGMYLAARCGRCSLPLIRGIERSWKTAGAVPLSAPIGRTVAEAIGVSAVCLSYTVLVFSIAHPTESEDLRKMMRAIGKGAESLVVLKALMSAPLFEEIVFRHFLQRALGMCFGGSVRGRALAIFLSSLAWGLGHASMVTPEWAKLAQTLGVGLALGWLYERRGLEASVFAHFLFNLVSAILANQIT